MVRFLPQRGRSPRALTVPTPGTRGDFPARSRSTVPFLPSPNAYLLCAPRLAHDPPAPTITTATADARCGRNISSSVHSYVTEQAEEARLQGIERLLTNAALPGGVKGAPDSRKKAAGDSFLEMQRQQTGGRACHSGSPISRGAVRSIHWAISRFFGSFRGGLFGLGLGSMAVCADGVVVLGERG